MTDNPFFEAWDTPFGLPPFARIDPAHFPPAFDRAMAEQEAEIAAIADSAEPPDFANTIEALERSGSLLRRVSRVFHNLDSSATNEALQAIDRDYAPKLAAHQMRIALDPGLFARIDALYRMRDSLSLTPEQRRLLERHHLRLVRSGARLDAEAKMRMSAISQRLASLHSLFGQNVLHDEDEWRLVLGEDELDGLPDFARDRPNSTDPPPAPCSWLARPELLPTRRARAAHPGRTTPKLIGEIMALRGSRRGCSASELCCLPARRRWQTPEAAGDLSPGVEPAKKRAAGERADLAAAALADGANEPIAPWDWRYYAEKVRQQKYAIDEAALKPYFVLEPQPPSTRRGGSSASALSAPRLRDLSPGCARL